MESETMSTTTESSFRNQGGRSRERTEPQKKMNKLRSIKLSRMPSTRKGRSSSNQFRAKLSGYAASSEQSTPIEMSDASPNHMKPTSSSDAKEENFQVLPVTLTTQSGYKLLRSVTRKSSMKFRRPQLKRSSVEYDMKKKLKKPSRREVDSSPQYLKASSSHSDSSFDRSEQNKKISTNEKQKSVYPGNKSIGVLRTSTLGPMRILTKMASLKSKRTKKCSEISSISDPSIERATFSSTLKDSKFPVHVETIPGGCESDGTAVSNVCRYSYCSLHVHHHGNKPPLKRFVSMRRRVPKSQKSLKQDCQSAGKAKHSGRRKKALQTEKRVYNGDLGVAVQQGNEGSDFVKLAKSVPGETLNPNPSHQENLQQSNIPLELEQQIPGTFQVFKDRSVDCSEIGAEQHKAISDTPGTKIKMQEILKINPNNGDHKSIHIVGHPICEDVSSQEFGDPRQFDKLSVKSDKTRSSCNERAPVEEEAHRDVNEGMDSSLNLEEYSVNSGNSINNLETASTGGSCELPNGLFSSASVTGMMEEPTSASEEKNVDSGILQTADPMASSSTDAPCQTETENQKNYSFWKLIYQHMVSGLDAELGTQKPLPGVNSEEQVENLHNANEKDDSRQEISWTDQAMSIEDHEASNRKLEFSQREAIKLVQQAFDKILSEVPDHSSYDQSIASEKTSDQDFLLKKQNEGKEVSISTSSNSIEDYLMQDGEEMKLQTDNKIASEEVKAAQMEVKRSNKQMPSSWSNLKKIMILNRFVKSLEKVRNLKPRTIHNLSTDKDAAVEKIQLRHQNMKGRKNAEEWMLDHALRQVISTLAPSQKRKVAMLVQAFETVTPLPENGDDMRSNAAASSPTTSVKAYSESSVHNGDSTENENGSEILPGKASNSYTASPEPQEASLLSSCTEQPLFIAGSEMSGRDMKKEDTNAVDDNNGNEVSFVMDVHQKLVDLSLSELEEPRLFDKSLNVEGAVRTSDEKFFPVNEEVIQRISKEETSILNSEVCNEGSELNLTKMDLESNDLINSADQHPGEPECLKEVGEGAQPKYKFLRSPVEQSESNFSADISKLERQKYMRLWYLIYKHMVSGNATENGFQPLQNIADEEVQGDVASKDSRKNNADCQDYFIAGQDMKENCTKGSQNFECHNSEIIKLVEEAIDEIPLPESQDSTSNNSYQVTGDVIPDQELLEKKHGEVEVKLISSSTDSSNENSEEAKNITAELRSSLNSKQKVLNSDHVNTQKEAKRGREEGNKSEKRVQRNWSNLKKIILLRRFVKALEKVREFNPRCPQYLPLNPVPSEKVLLRHQNMEDRKNSEEWMLDYALQQVVSKLTPERKRRVELLVEAFETVIPTIS